MGQVLIVRGHTLGGAGHGPGGDDQAFPLDQGNRLVAGQGAGANLGPLQILEDGHGAFLAVGLRTHPGDAAGVFCVGAVGEIEADDVHPGGQQGRQALRRIGGGPQRDDDLGSAHDNILPIEGGRPALSTPDHGQRQQIVAWLVQGHVVHVHPRGEPGGAAGIEHLKVHHDGTPGIIVQGDGDVAPLGVGIVDAENGAVHYIVGVRGS